MYFDEHYRSEIEEKVFQEAIHLKRQGTKVFGVYGAFTPKELISAAGATPVSLCAGTEKPIEEAEKHLPRFLCSLIKSSYGHARSYTCPTLFDCNLPARIREMEAAITVLKRRAGDAGYLQAMTAKPRLLLTGCPITNRKVLDILEQSGAVVAAMENCGGLKTIASPVPEDGDPLQALYPGAHRLLAQRLGADPHAQRGLPGDDRTAVPHRFRAKLLKGAWHEKSIVSLGNAGPRSDRGRERPGRTRVQDRRVTPSLSASEDEFRGAQMAARHNPGMIKHIVLPVNFETEQETAISQILSLADDKNVKAIVICAGCSGILSAIQKAKAKRGVTIPTKAKKMGAKTFIHYSFPTHLAKEVIAKRRDMMKQTCAKPGMRFVEVVTPDPQAGSDVSTMQQFLMEDIPRQIAKYGGDTCIFGTNCPMQDIIIAKALELKFIMAEQCCPWASTPIKCASEPSCSRPCWPVSVISSSRRTSAC